MVEVEIPEGVKVEVTGDIIKVKGPLGEIERIFPIRSLSIKSSNGSVDVTNNFKDVRSRVLIGTFVSHIKNMMKGVQEPFIYKLKICYIHFPMSVTVSGNKLQIQNFLGSKKPRDVKIPEGAKVSVDGDIITIESINKETAGMAATRIEQTTRLTNKDRRVFQDGIFITEKAGKVLQ